jgi:hypothetical protein
MSLYLKVIACEIAVREICHAVSKSTNTIDLEFVPQGLHDHPKQGKIEVQKRVDAVPPDRYDAILVGYALCGNLITGLEARHTRLVIPRAHDCITFFLGSQERYLNLSATMPGAYFYTSGWLECVRRRGETMPPTHPAYTLPSRAGAGEQPNAMYEQWVAKYGEEQARHLLEVMSHWAQNYTHGVLIDFDFTKSLHLHEQVQAVCAKRGWQFEEIEGDIRLLQHWVDGEWDPASFLVVGPGERVVPSYREDVILAEPGVPPAPTV